MRPGYSEERARLGQAVVEVMLESGYEGVSVEAILARSGLDRDAFESHFDDLHAAVIGTYWDRTNEFNDLVLAAYDRGSDWRSSLRSAAYAAAYYLRDNPDVVRFGTLMLFQAGSMAQAERETHLRQMVDLIDAGRQELEDPSSVDRGVAEGVFGSIYESVVHAQGSGGGTRSAVDMVPELMYIAVRPYLGQEAAREGLDPSAGPMNGPCPPRRPNPDLVWERVRMALMDLVFERGYPACSSELLIARASVSRTEFDQRFADLEDCFRQVANQHIAYFSEVRGVSEVVDAERDQILQRLVGAIDDGRRCLEDPDELDRGVAEAVVGSIQRRAETGMRASEVSSARNFVPELMYIAVRPYLGRESASEELSIPPPTGTGGYRGNRG